MTHKEKIDKAMKVFLDNGGVIEKIPMSTRSIDPYGPIKCFIRSKRKKRNTKGKMG